FKDRYMNLRQKLHRFFCGCLITSQLAGCHGLGTDTDLHYLGDKELQYYEDVATKIEYPAVFEETPEEITFSGKPRTLADRSQDQIWDLPLMDAIHLGLANSEVIRVAGTLGTNGNGVLNNPDGTPTIFDPSIQETNVLLGGSRGVEAALSAFDTTFTANMLWGRSEQVQNSPFFGGSPGGTLTQETGQFQSGLSKTFANGGQFALSHNWNYTGSNATSQLFPSSYAGNAGLSYRQPFLAGAGVDYTRIAGPIGSGFTGITGVSQGVVIARINNDLVLADFEKNVRNLVSDIEETYWQLYLAYRLYDTQVVARNSALRSWREAHAKLEAGGTRNFKPADEAQAKDRLFETQSLVQATRSDIYTAESRFRRLVGLPVNDGKIIRPIDDPVSAEFTPDWSICLTEGLVHRVELRKQKWNIKSLEFQRMAATSLTRPRLDLVSSYQVNGFGDQLLSQKNTDGVTSQGLHNAYGTLLDNDQDSWTIGWEFSMPLGFRSAHAQVENLEFRISKARALLQAQEMDVSQELAITFQDLAKNYATAQSNFNRWRAARRRVELFDAEVQAGTTTLDTLLRAQSSLASAETEYYRSLVAYNVAIKNLHKWKGTLLKHNNIHLMEGEWSPAAYQQAIRRAWARTHGIDADRLQSKPEPFVADGYIGEVGVMPAQEGASYESGQERVTPDILPVPEPEMSPDYAPPVPATSSEPAARLEYDPESRNPFAATNSEKAVNAALSNEAEPSSLDIRRVSATQDELPIVDTEQKMDVEFLPATSFVE
ncbi:TolC family protein, partial [uncultured Gimesia sp.]|uniref:TolC family protein n=1 Tax=uncultured Gimesia sp. TaxID=1678688 RepID=UPI002623FA20